jgi:sugar lactone lactonase YvrE
MGFLAEDDFMTRSFTHESHARRWPALGGLALLAALVGSFNASACSDDDEDDDGGNGGTSAAGDGGTSSAGDGGTANAGASGSGLGGSGVGGSGSLPGGGPTGTIQVLNDQATELLGPTTAALRGQNIWVTNGQLGQLGATPQLPFTAISVPLAGGDIGETPINLVGDTFFPEGIAAAEDGTLYIGSVALGTIVRVPADSTTPEAFAADTVSERGVIGLKVDDDRELLWFCDSDPRQNPSAAAVVGLSLDDGSEVVRHELTAAGSTSFFCNDILVDPAGNVWATESFAGIVYRIPSADVMTADSAEIWLEGGEAAPPMPGGFGANGLALVGGQLIVANGGTGTLFAVDPASSDPAADARRITLTEGSATTPVTLCGPDGLLAVPGSSDELIVVENGGCTPSAPRIVKITLDL